eukprot:TRINITY_DN991_c0_g1_i3.p1 TRINITY_DN991_c0_g1~~TRINITY_DN991_c0_g1_i3.p1  ORF type:complete len:325 (+),score=53.07 TRINITY_DN991_c0_g1_i3:141-1115(+)
MIRRPPRSTHCISSAASDVYKRQIIGPLQKIKKMKALILVLALLVAISTCQNICSQNYPVKVTLLVFADGNNPSWLLDSDIKNTLCQENKIKSSPCVSTKMGYNGFSLEANGQKVIINNDIYTELMILLSSQKTLPTEVANHVIERIQKPSYECDTAQSQITPNVDCSDVVGPDTVPAFDVATDCKGCFSSHQTENNCYNYGSDIATDTFAQPGRGSGQKWSYDTCDDIRASAQRDGLTWIGQDLPSDQPTTGHYVALFMWPNTNFHWIRKDNCDYWSHKPGQTAARDTDNNGQKIVDPRQSDFSPWTEFCGFMQAIPSTLKIN